MVWYELQFWCNGSIYKKKCWKWDVIFKKVNIPHTCYCNSYFSVSKCSTVMLPKYGSWCYLHIWCLICVCHSGSNTTWAWLTMQSKLAFYSWYSRTGALPTFFRLNSGSRIAGPCMWVNIKDNDCLGHRSYWIKYFTT